MPFSIKQEERQEIRDIGKVFFYGGNPERDSELKDIWHKWQMFFEMFMMCIDARYGNFLHLPFNCDLVEMPHKTMEVFFLLQQLFREKLDKATKDAASKIRKR